MNKIGDRFAHQGSQWSVQLFYCGLIGFKDIPMDVGDQVAVGRKLEKVLVAFAFIFHRRLGLK